MTEIVLKLIGLQSNSMCSRSPQLKIWSEFYESVSKFTSLHLTYSLIFRVVWLLFILSFRLDFWQKYGCCSVSVNFHFYSHPFGIFSTSGSNLCTVMQWHQDSSIIIQVQFFSTATHAQYLGNCPKCAVSSYSAYSSIEFKSAEKLI